MLNNFTGTTKRRNVNLSTYDRKNRRDLLDKAAKERERRALDRLELEKVVILQKNINRYLSIKKLYNEFAIQGIEDIQGNASTIWCIFYPIFINFDSRNDFNISNQLVDFLNEPVGSSPAERILNYTILSSINQLVKYDTQQSYTLITKLWSKISVPVIFNEEETDQVILYLQNLKFCQNIDINSVLCLSQRLNITSLMQILKQDYSSVSSVLIHKIFQNIPIFDIKYNAHDLSIESYNKLSNVIINLSFFFDKSNLNDGDKAYATNIREWFSIFVLNILEYNRNLFHHEDSSRLKINLTRYDDNGVLMYEEFHTMLINNFIVHNKDDLFEISCLLKLTTEIIYRKSLISLLIQGKVLSKVYEQVIINHNFEYLELLTDLMNLYLLTKSDFQLVNNVGMNIISMDNLLQICYTLKDLLFDTLWSTPVSSENTIYHMDNQTTNKVLNLLKTLQVRDNRAKFFKQIDMWTIDNLEFRQVDITNLFTQFEDYYREVSDSIEEETAYDDILRTAKLRDKSDEILEKFIERKKLMRQASNRQIQKFKILGTFPGFISFEERVYWFQNVLIESEKSQLGVNEDTFLMPWLMRNNMQRIKATISRNNILKDSYDAFDRLGEKFKAKLALTFTNEFGEEAGIDGGGLTKEFLTSVTQDGFLQHQNLFVENENHVIYCKPYTHIKQSDYNLIRFMGKCLGKCLYENVLIDVQFATFFLNKLLKCDRLAGGYRSSFDELSSMDPQLYQNLMKLWTMDPDQLESLNLAFEVTDEENPYGKMIELIPNGSQVLVNRNNVLEYMNKVADYKMNSRRILISMKAFIEGFNTIIPQHWINLFSPLELQKLISGGESQIDILDLQQNTEYGGYLSTDQTIIDLWDVLENEFDSNERAKFVKFVTSVPKAPLSGFKSLQPLFGIRNAGRETDKLPTSSTCVNLLKLPDYRNKQLLAAKLRQSIHSESGFDLS